MVQTIINYELGITNYELTPSKSKSYLSFNPVNPDSDIVLNKIFLILRWTGFWGGQNQAHQAHQENHGSDRLIKNKMVDILSLGKFFRNCREVLSTVFLRLISLTCWHAL